MSGPSSEAAESSPCWIEWAKKLQTMSQTGLTYARDLNDIQRYREIAQIAVEMMAEGSGISRDSVFDIFSHETGHATPKIDVRVATFRGKGSDVEILLVRELRDGCWTLPGGWADVGETVSEAAAREMAEESGYVVNVTRLLAVWDKRKHPHPPQAFYVCKLVFEAEIIDSISTGGDGIETDGVAFYALNKLPPLSLDRILPSQIKLLFELHEEGPSASTLFD